MLFKATTELTKFTAISHTTNFDNLSPIIRNAEEDVLIPVISKDLFDALNTGVQNEPAMTDDMKALLQRCRDVVAPLVAYNFTPLTEVKLSDAGAQRTATQNYETAYQNQVLNFREQCLKNHAKAIERLYTFLENNITVFPQWAASEEFKMYRSMFIKTGGDFNTQVQTQSPYANYYAMRSFMYDVENNIIKKLIGVALFNTLKGIDADPDGIFTESQSELLKYIKKAIAFLTISTAIPFLNVRLDSNGFTIMNAASAQNDAQTKRSAADADRMNNYIDACKKMASDYVNNISACMVENMIVNPQPTFKPGSGNTERKGSFSFL